MNITTTRDSERPYLPYSPNKKIVLEYRNFYNATLGPSGWRRRLSGLSISDKESSRRIEESVLIALRCLRDIFCLDYPFGAHIAIIRDISECLVRAIASNHQDVSETDALYLAVCLVDDLYADFAEKRLAFDGGELYAENGILYMMICPAMTEADIYANLGYGNTRGIRG